jgi:hypothetical protein
MTYVVVHLRSSVVDERTGKVFRWSLRLEEGSAARWLELIHAGKVFQPSVGRVVAWLEGEAEPT